MPKKIPKYTKKQKALLREVAKDPEASNYEIDKKLNNLGIVKSNNYTQQLIRRDTEVAQKIAILREKYELQIIRKVPKAGKVIDKHLKDNNLDAAKLVYRHALPVLDDSKKPTPPQTVNILAIQQHIHHEMTKEDNDVIDVSSS